MCIRDSLGVDLVALGQRFVQIHRTDRGTDVGHDEIEHRDLKPVSYTHLDVYKRQTDTSRPEPVDAHTVFRLASLSKSFAGTLTGMLVNDGVLSWNQPCLLYTSRCV